MQEKDMFLKKNNFSIIFFLITFFLKNTIYAETKDNLNIVNYLQNLDEFSANFLQNNKGSISEGKISIGLKRVRVDYETPSKILIILSETKGMYYNYDLDEDEFFNPSDTSAGFFFDIFNNQNFFSDSKLIKKNNLLTLEKKGFLEENEYKIKISFEDSPLILRKIQLSIEDDELILSIFDHNFNAQFDKNFFKLINPNFFNK